MTWSPQAAQFRDHVTFVSAGAVAQNPGSVGAGATVTFNITVPGSLLGDQVDVMSDAPFANLLTMTGEVSPAGTVAVKIHNVTAGSLSAPNTTYRAVCYRFDPQIYL